MTMLSTPTPDQNLIKDATTKTFMTDVVEASKSVPVIVDFWAPWCGPCKTLGPSLEKVVREARGKVRLVKVDIDKSPEVASQFRVQSIPAVFAFVDGRPVDGFMGAVPESQIRQFIDRLGNMGGRAGQIEAALQMARDGLVAGDHEDVLDIAGQIIEIEPTSVEAYALKARAEMALDHLDAAAATLDSAPVDKATDAALISARAALELLLNPVDTSGISSLEARISANANDYAARLELATLLNGSGDRLGAIDQLIYVIQRDRTFADDGARKQLVSYFEAWGPKEEATLAGRRKLSAVLFS